MSSAVWRLLIARAVSLIGTEAAYTVLSYQLYARTGSAEAASLVLVLTVGLMGLLVPFGGVLSDRFGRERVLVISDAAGAAVFVTLCFVTGDAALLVGAALAAVCSAPALSAAQGLLPSLAEASALERANSLFAVSWSIGLIAGPLLGGLALASIGPTPVFAMDAGSFLISAALIISLPSPEVSRHADASEMSADPVAGLRHVFTDPLLRRIAASYVVALLGFGAVQVAQFGLSTNLGSGSQGFGVLNGSLGVGLVVGAVFTPRLMARMDEPKLIAVGFGVMAAAFAAVGLSDGIKVAALGLAFGGIGIGVIEVAEQCLVQRESDPMMRSRVLSIFEATSLITLTIAYLIAGALSNLITPQVMYLAASVAAALACGVVAYARHVDAVPISHPPLSRRGNLQ